MDTIKTVDAMTAIMIMEAMNEARDTAPGLDDLWEEHGTPAMRHLALRMAPAFNAFWDSIGEDERHQLIPFDFGVVPAIVAATDWSQLSQRVYDNDPIPLLDGVDYAVRKDTYVEAVRSIAQRDYAYGDLASDHEEAVAKALRDGETPDALVDRLARKYDLDRVISGPYGF